MLLLYIFQLYIIFITSGTCSTSKRKPKGGARNEKRKKITKKKHARTKQDYVEIMINFVIPILLLAIFFIVNVWAYKFSHTDQIIPPMDFSEFSAGISIEKENISEDVVLKYSQTNAISKDNYEYVYDLHNSVLANDYVFVTNEKLREEKVTVSVNFDKLVAKHNEIDEVEFGILSHDTKEISVTRYNIKSHLDFGTFVNKNNTSNETDQINKDVYEKYTSLYVKIKTTDSKPSAYVYFGTIILILICFLDVLVFAATIVFGGAIVWDLVLGD